MRFIVFGAYLLAALALSTGQETSTSACCYVLAKGYLQSAVDLISKADNLLPNGDCGTSCREHLPDCAELLRSGQNVSGVYKVWPWSRLLEDSSSVNVYCDMITDGGGWTVIQRRGEYGRAKDFFFQDWNSYKNGFGSVEEDFWLGNDKISALTNQRKYSIRFDLVDVEGVTAYAQYDQFWIEDENNSYTMHAKGYTGTAGDSLASQIGMKFTTKDRDNDIWNKNCAEEFKGAWWYSNCHSANLNGLYLKGVHESYADGIEWSTWKGQRYSLLKTEMKLRPQNFNLLPRYGGAGIQPRLNTIN